MERGRDKFNRFKPTINILVKFYSLFPRGIRVKFFEYFRMTKGKKGLLIRYVLLKTIANNVGDNVAVHPNVYIFNYEGLSIGNNVSIHPMSYIEAKGGIKIGDDVSIAHAVTLLSVNHIYSDINTPIKDQGIDYKETEIKSNVWIGAKASVLAGIMVGSGSIIATGAVVTKNVDEYAVVGGIPATVIKYRK
jgi:acetyltransferase-like isoleucine patch superfamily enzyme